MKSEKLLQTLSNAFGTPSFEDEVRDIIRKEVEGLADEVRTDRLGNLIAVKKGKRETCVMIDAHMDEIGLMIDRFDERGFLRFMPVGVWDERLLPSHMVTILTRSGRKVRGLIGTKAPHAQTPDEKERPIGRGELFIDIGAANPDEAAKRGINIGDPVVLAHPSEMLGANCVVGKAFDDRAGCAVLVKVLEALAGRKTEMTVACNFAVSEEKGHVGAKAAVAQLRPEIALVIEGTVSADLPNIPPGKRVGLQGKGPLITIADKKVVVRREIIMFLEDLARKKKIPCQHKALGYSTTNAEDILPAAGGVPVGIVSVPCRYIHSAYSTVRLDDFEHTVKLVTEFARSCHTLVR